jgi:signal transduction histidine kinase
MRSLRVRLLVAVILVVVAAVGAIAWFGTRVTVSEFQGYMDRRWTMRDERFRGFLSMHHSLHGDWDSAQQALEEMEELTGERVVLADPLGMVLADSEGERIGETVGRGWGPPAGVIMDRGVPVGALYINPPDGSPASAAAGETVVSSVNRGLLWIAVVAGLVAVALVLGASRRIFAPVEALTAAVRRMKAGDLDQRVEVESDDEIGELGLAFNGMADELARAEQLRRNMVSDVAHELRTPLTSIRGYLEAMREGMLEPEPQLIESLHEEALLLNHLVDDLQELSLAEAGQLRLDPREVSVADVISHAVTAAGPRGEAGNVDLHVDVADDLPLVEIDARRIGQVLRNLLDNALRHTPPGGEVSVAARLVEDGVEVSVRDTGSGIDPSDLPYVFERFYRADKARSRDTGGVGLGLAIAMQLIEAHGRTIEVESEPGEGARFYFVLPVAGAQGEPQQSG